MVLVAEIHADCEVIQGSLPEGLSGAFIRTGPNPYFAPGGRYHWFDGDGMAHVVRINNGKATYCNRWVETNRLKEEITAGYPAGGKVSFSDVVLSCIQ